MCVILLCRVGLYLQVYSRNNLELIAPSNQDAMVMETNLFVHYHRGFENNRMMIDRII